MDFSILHSLFPLAQQTAHKSPALSFLPLLLLCLGMWFLMIAPQRKRQKQMIKMLQELKAGDKILTISGVYGTIDQIKEDRLIVKIAENTKIEINKSSIQSKI